MKYKEFALVGLGRMGRAIGEHLTKDGYTVHGFDTDSKARSRATKVGIQTHDSLQKTIAALHLPRTVWLMIPSRYVDEMITELTPLLSKNDTVIDGGNSFFKNSIERHHELSQSGINFIDCGTSGGVDGALHGASLMVGGDAKTVKHHEEMFKALATENGYGYVGGPGSGHFVKMVHNGIEYGMMGAIAEGINVLHEHKDGLGIDMLQALNPYEHGSIIESNLMSWLSDAYHEKGHLEKIAGQVPKGETEMEMEYLVQHENVRVLDAALLQRKLTRIEPSFIGTLIAAMRNAFGGHKVIKKQKK